MKYWLAIIFLLLGSLTVVTAQKSAIVYSLSDHSEEVGKILKEDHVVLLKHYDGNMEAAMKDWYGMLSALEAYAEAEAVDLNGVKVWMNVFFSPDGSIKALGYHPKGDSKKFDWAVFEALVKEFSKQYHFPVQMEESFSHYAAAMWPVEMLER